MEKMVWNTGRMFSDYGQIISARISDPDKNSDVMVTFLDITRGIDGKFTASAKFMNDLDFAKKAILNRYDAGAFTPLSFEEEKALKLSNRNYEVIAYEGDVISAKTKQNTPGIVLAYKILNGMDSSNLEYHVIFEDSAGKGRIAFCRRQRLIERGRAAFARELVEFLSA